jgi:hypothetical protein
MLDDDPLGIVFMFGSLVQYSPQFLASFHHCQAMPLKTLDG